MTTRDKTREKLLNSMRKTKAVINDQPDSKQAHAETYAPPAKKPAPARTEAPAELPPSRPAPGSDPYQSRGRVWPD
ncbi:MAG: hypothetical protein GC149_09835 [Gammaproteobacteria bacterium]|nr:hypothetical protein [Gammaproteobacteria bacterium]